MNPSSLARCPLTILQKLRAPRWAAWWCAILLLPIWGAMAAPAESGFESGNRFYDGGKYPEAIAAYEEQAARGEYSANLFYNLANAYYRNGERGRAILNYQRALILDPAHAEAAANLAYLRARLPGPAEETPWWRQTLGSVRIDAYVWLASVAGWLALAGLMIGKLARDKRAAAWSIAFLMAVLCAGGIAAVWTLDDGTKNTARAVVLEDQTKALYAPADNSPLVGSLSAGGEVRVLGAHRDWVYAQLPDGKRAWIPAAKVERIVLSTAATAPGHSA